MFTSEETELLLPGVPLDCTALPLHLSRPDTQLPISTLKNWRKLWAPKTPDEQVKHPPTYVPRGCEPGK